MIANLCDRQSCQPIEQRVDPLFEFLRFGIIQFKKSKEKKIKESIFEKVFVLLFFILIIGLILYSIYNFF